MDNNETIPALVRKLENQYTSSETNISKYVNFNMWDNINKIDAYLNSKHISGAEDSLGREKPFFNIVTAATNIWYRATDIDRKDIKIKATNSKELLPAFIATIHLQDYMRRDAFGVFLNEWGRSLARYGSSVIKFVVKAGKLHTSIVPWNRLICDTVDFDSNLKIERLYLTPSQLRKNKAYDQEMVENLLTALTARKNLQGNQIDTKNDFIELYEVHGELPNTYLKDEEDWNEADAQMYSQQMHVISFVAKAEKGKFDDFTLVKGKEAKDPYMITHLIKEDGRTQAIGAVEYLFDAQWMVNHSAKSIKDQLDLASKLIFQTADGSFVGQNALNSIETGDIMIHEPNMPLTQIANNSHDITSLQSYSNQWKALSQEITSTPDAIAGNTMPSGTAYRQVAALQQESHSLFELMTENKGLAIEDMLRKYIIPYLKTKLNTSDEIAATLRANDISKIDSMFIDAEVVRRNNQNLIDAALDENGMGGSIPAQFDPQLESQKIKDDLQKLGDQRFLKPSDIPDKTWKEIFKDLEWEVEVEVTNESKDKQAVLTSLSELLQTIANPNTAQVMQTPQGKFLFNKILETTGEVSPIELSSLQSTPQPQVSTQQPSQMQPTQPTT